VGRIMPRDFYENIKLSKGLDKSLIRKAFSFAEKAHAGQKRKSGDEYISHPFSVAKILLSLGMESDIIAAALLHDTIEDTNTSPEEIEKVFGTEVAALVMGVTNLGKVDFSAYSTSEEAEEALLHSKNENMRQLFLAMAEDVRVVIIKLADRLHNMQTVKSLPKKDQIRVAKETLNIFSPLALRLGMGEIKGELEDLAFPIAYPKEYALLKKEANRRYKAADRYMMHVKRIISDKLREEGIKARIDGRSKHIFSLYKKITRPEINWDFDKIYDLVALRVITDTIEECYRALGIIHAMYRPLPNYIRDYISAPKPNGYRSIHTSVFGPDAKIIEIQIRTKEMHEEAEYGVASHLHYTEQKSKGASDEKLAKGTFGDQTQTDFLKRIKEWQQGSLTAEEFVEGLKIEFLDDRIYVFSPLGDIHDLPVGATPVDFAYEVHSRIGDSCRGAKVNGKIVPLDYVLQTRDIVEIITQKDAGPKRDWLDFVKTSKSKQHIRSHFRQFDYERNRTDGKKLVADELAVLGIELEKISAPEMKDAISDTAFKSVNDLYASVGGGLTTLRQAVKIILRKSYIPEVEKKVSRGTEMGQKALSKGMKATVAPCCNPKPTDRIICYITRGKGLTAHKSTCPNLKSLEKERLVLYNPWAKDKLKVRLEIKGLNRVGLIRDITAVISDNGINIESFKDARHQDDHSIIEAVVSVEDLAECAELIKKLKGTRDIEEVKRA
jgi:guanosine-3',5'-bis(diphosphate) 3'-pyrophosphohydrolase